MAYIADLDPQVHDPALDLPFICYRCGFTGTAEDCIRSGQCPACWWWDGEDIDD